MFDRKHLKKSLVFPLLVTVGIIIIGALFETVKLWALLVLYGEHILIALAFGADLEKYKASGGFIRLPLVPWAAIAAVAIDYLLLAAIAYAFLFIEAKRSARSSKAGPADGLPGPD